MSDLFLLCRFETGKITNTGFHFAGCGLPCAEYLVACIADGLLKMPIRFLPFCPQKILDYYVLTGGTCFFKRHHVLRQMISDPQPEYRSARIIRIRRIFTGGPPDEKTHQSEPESSVA